MKRRLTKQGQKYLDAKFLPPALSVCERFLSEIRNALSLRRRKTELGNFEFQIFLHVAM